MFFNQLPPAQWCYCFFVGHWWLMDGLEPTYFIPVVYVVFTLIYSSYIFSCIAYCGILTDNIHVVWRYYVHFKIQTKTCIEWVSNQNKLIHWTLRYSKWKINTWNFIALISANICKGHFASTTKKGDNRADTLLLILTHCLRSAWPENNIMVWIIYSRFTLNFLSNPLGFMVCDFNITQNIWNGRDMYVRHVHSSV